MRKGDRDLRGIVIAVQPRVAGENDYSVLSAQSRWRHAHDSHAGPGTLATTR